MLAWPVSQYISTNINNTKGLNATTYLPYTPLRYSYLHTLSRYVMLQKIFHQDKIRVFLFLLENYIVSESVTKTKNNGL